MIIAGLTGGIGMGKSTADQMLRQRGVSVVDTDILAREVVEPGQPALGEIEESFGAEVIGTDGRLARERLASLVFSDPEKRKQLEGILHPRIRALWKERMEGWSREGVSIGVVVIPLLFETGAERELDVTICVACSTATQMRRLSERGWPAAQVRQRLQAQWPIQRKMDAADFMIWNDSGLEVLSGQVDLMLASLGARAS